MTGLLSMRWKLNRKGNKQIHWACKTCLIRACCGHYCSDANLPFGFDDIPDHIMKLFEVRMLRRMKIENYLEDNSILKFQTALEANDFKRISSWR